MNEGKVLLTFDLEEFDMPLEYNFPISLEEQIQLSREGTLRILNILTKFNIKATFFCTCTFAHHNTALIQQICQAGHELASHGYYHSKFDDGDLLKSKEDLESISGFPIYGFRMPRMMPVSSKAITHAGYQYDSSLHPVFIPGRYNNLDKPRTAFKKDDLWEIPASASPLLRIPLFWLSFHHFPLWLYTAILKTTIRKDKYVVLYFHPWEFVNLKNEYGLTYLTTKTTGTDMINKFERLIRWMNKNDYYFTTLHNFIETKSVYKDNV